MNKLNEKDKIPYEAELFLSILILLTPSILILNLSQSFVEGFVIIPPIILLSIKGKSFFNNYYMKNNLVYFFVAFVILTAFSQLLTPYFFHGLDSLRKFHVKLVMLVLTWMFVVKNEKLQRFLFLGFILTLLISSIFGYYQFFFGRESLNFLWAPPSSWEKAISPFGDHKNQFGTYLAFSILMSLGWILLETKAKNRLTLKSISVFLLIIFSIPILYLSLSRQAQGAVAVGLTIYILGSMIIFDSTTRKFLWLGCACFLTVISILYYFSPESGNRWLEKLSVGNLSGRITSIWPNTWTVFMERPFFGYDLSSETFNKISPTSAAHEHNTFLYFLFRTGLLGFVGFISFTLTGLFESLRLFFSSKLKSRKKILILIFTNVFISIILAIGVVGIPYEFLFKFIISLWFAEILFQKSALITSTLND